MKFQINPKLQNLQPYEPVSGKYCIRLDANESFFDGKEIRQLVADAAAQTVLNRYPNSSADEVVEAFSNLYGINPALVTAGNGSDELIGVIVSAFCETGDTIATIMPDFSMYSFYGDIYGYPCRVIEKEKDLQINVQKVIEIVNREKSRILLFSNPCNPTSLGLERQQVRQIIENINALVVLDEAYMDFWNQSLLEEVEKYDNVIILKTASKALGLAGLRLGFAVANERISGLLKAVKSPYNVNSLTQNIGAAVLRQKELLACHTAEILKSRDWLQNALAVLAKEKKEILWVYPSCTNFIFVKLEKAKQVFEKLKQQGIIVRLIDGNLRITAGNAEENQALLQSLEEILT